MNKKRILALADLIEQQQHTSFSAESGFSMSSYVHECGTPSCIAGWASWLSFGKAPVLADEILLFDRARGYLGLKEDAAKSLFLPANYQDQDLYTPTQAAETLRHLAKTGEVDWSVSS